MRKGSNKKRLPLEKLKDYTYPLRITVEMREKIDAHLVRMRKDMPEVRVSFADALRALVNTGLAAQEVRK